MLALATLLVRIDRCHHVCVFLLTSTFGPQIPEALGLASGVVFLVCIVLFQQLHHLDLPATLQHAMGGRDPPSAPSQVLISLCTS